MLDQAFEKNIIDLLKTHYDLQLCHIKELSNEADDYKTFRLRCKDNQSDSYYPIRMILESYNYENIRYHNFHVFSEDKTCRSSIVIDKKIYPSVIQKALADIKNEVPEFLMDSSFIYLLSHDNISLISGSYYYNGSDIVVTHLNPIVETVSDIFFFSPNRPSSTYTFCLVNIKGDKLYIRPIKGYDNDTAFNKPVTFDDDGIKLFKAYLLKCLLIYCNSELFNTSDYLHLDYDAMKKYLLLLEMAKI